MDVSIIIVNYNTRQLTANCLNSIFEKTAGVSFEVLLVDNASTDGSAELFRNDGRITFIEAGANLGFGRANNLGLEQARGEYILFLNSDTLLLNNSVALFHSYMEAHSHERIGALGCVLQNADGQAVHSYAKLPTPALLIAGALTAPFSAKWGNRVQGFDRAKRRETADFEVGYVTGADLFVSRSVLDECGTFDPDFFMYFEETEMQSRFHRRHYRNMITRGPQIVHLEGMSQTSVKRRDIDKMIRGQRSMFVYVRKTGGAWRYLVFRGLFAIVRLPFILCSRRTTAEKQKYIGFLFRRNVSYARADDTTKTNKNKI